jgi:scyllo-inositol 2-dehydrogenase (NADP+)
MQRVKVGLVGYGYAGATIHAPFITAAEALELVCVASSGAEKVHADFPGLEVVGDPEALFAHPEVELVVIATPNTTHFRLAAHALRAGKHVVLEKPFVNSVAEADALLQLARKTGRVLSVFHNRRWDSDFLTVRACIEDGRLGRVYTYEAHFDRFRPHVRDRWREQALEGSGSLYDLGSHLIDQALVLFGPPQTVYADLQAQRPGSPATDYFHLVLGYGALRVILHGGALVRQPGPHFMVHGDQGSFLKHGMDPQEDALRAGERPGSPGWGTEPAAQHGILTRDATGEAVAERVATLPGNYTRYYEGVARAIQEDTPVPVPASEARTVIAVIEAALQSNEERRVVAFTAPAA